ncbi:helix-turn-helix transcriptional regulator [Bacillus sp. BGMRC 2118]|nr:helix-turn-helix transcriptional regulator [Bacillus sp. BGMRC 2118]
MNMAYCCNCQFFSSFQSYQPFSGGIIMFKEFGKILRYIREQKGYGLNQFASQIGVSPAYLSNLETGKSDTIKLHILENLEKEFQLFHFSKSYSDEDDFSFRIEYASNKLIHLKNTNPQLASFLLQTLENGINLTETSSSASQDVYTDYRVQ